jgi:hypothetical protein
MILISVCLKRERDLFGLRAKDDPLSIRLSHSRPPIVLGQTPVCAPPSYDARHAMEYALSIMHPEGG